MKRVTWPARLAVQPSWRLVAAACGVTAFVAADAAAGSYQHQYEQAIRYDQAHWDAGLFPLSVDGMIVAATLVLWSAARRHKGIRQTWPAYVVLGIGIAVTVIINLAPAYPWWGVWLRPLISAWPAVAFVAAYEMTVWLVRMAGEDAAPSAGAGQPWPPQLVAGSAPEAGPASPGPGAPRPGRRRARSGTASVPAWRKLPPDELAAIVRAAPGRNALARELGCSRQSAGTLLREHANGHAGGSGAR